MEIIRIWTVIKKQVWLLKEKREYLTKQNSFPKCVTLFFHLVIILIFTEKNSSRNFTQLLSKFETYGQVGDYLILL